MKLNYKGNTGILIRFDDVAPNMNWEMMDRCQNLLDSFNIKPVVGDFYFFPNYLMHTAYPFSVEGERRSFSFNLEVDKKISKTI